jgi:hypothetical protein
MRKRPQARGQLAYHHGFALGSVLALGFGEKVECALLQGLHRQASTALGYRTDDHDRRGAARPLESIEHSQPVHLGHLHIKGQKIGVEVEHLLQGDLAVGRRAYDLNVGNTRQSIGNCAAKHRGVICDQDAKCHLSFPPAAFSSQKHSAHVQALVGHTSRRNNRALLILTIEREDFI